MCYACAGMDVREFRAVPLLAYRKSAADDNVSAVSIGKKIGEIVNKDSK